MTRVSYEMPGTAVPTAATTAVVAVPTATTAAVSGVDAVSEPQGSSQDEG